MAYPLRQEELTGDPDTATFWLDTPKVALPGVAADDVLVGELVVTRRKRFLAIYQGAAGSGDFDIPVYELTGGPSATNVILVVPKAEVPEAVGTDLTATLVEDAEGWTLLAPLPAA